MMLQQKSVAKRTLSKGINNPVRLGRRPTDSRPPIESLLRDVAFVLHATQAVRQAMEADRALCAAAS